MYLIRLLTANHTRTHLCSAVCDINQMNSPGLTLLNPLPSPPLPLTPHPPTLIPSAGSTASVSGFFCGRPGHAGEQALPGAIHFPQVSLSLWMMFLPNYLDPEPQHQPPPHTRIHTHHCNPPHPSLFLRYTTNTNTNINPA